MTISDIAKLAGVSKSTVSRVLTGSTPVREELKMRVLEVIEKYHYSPNLTARSLSLKKTNTIGVILNLDPNYHFRDYVSMETLRGLSVAATEAGIRLSIALGSIAAILPKLVGERGVDGVVIMGLKEGDEKVLSSISQTTGTKQEQILILLLNYSEEFKSFPSVAFSHEEDAYSLIRYLLEKGHTKIGIIECSPELIYIKNRKRGFLRAFKDFNVYFKESWDIKIEGINEDTAGKEAAEYFLSLKEKPSVVIASSDSIAISFMGRLLACGVEIPKDVSVVGMDDIPLSKYIHPALTTEILDGFSRGKKACELMCSLMHSEEIEDRHIFIRSAFVERDSLFNLKTGKPIEYFLHEKGSPFKG